MRIIVCLKQIPHHELIRYNPIENTLNHIYWTINPADLFALEEGLKIKEKNPRTVITALSIGPERVEKELKKALIYGVDRAVRVWQSWMEELDTWQTASIIASIAKIIGFDLILCGARSKDSSSEFMGAALSEKLNASLVTRAAKIEIKDEKEIIVHKKLERGERETYILELPAVVTVEERPEFTYVPPLSRTFPKGFKKEVEFMDLENLNFSNLKPLVSTTTKLTQFKFRPKQGPKIKGLSPFEIMKILRGETKRRELFEGPPEDAAKKILEKLKEWGAFEEGV